MAQEVKEFSELVKGQYSFLMQQLEKVLKDYFDLSSRGEGDAYGDFLVAGTVGAGCGFAVCQ